MQDLAAQLWVNGDRVFCEASGLPAAVETRTGFGLWLVGVAEDTRFELVRVLSQHAFRVCLGCSWGYVTDRDLRVPAATVVPGRG
jgi:hypothetical protein